MTEKSSGLPIRTIILFVIFIPVIGYLLHFAYQKSTQAEEKADQCQAECSTQGYSGHEFQWDIFGGPRCQCIGDIR